MTIGNSRSCTQASVDAFGRFRTSSPETLLANKQLTSIDAGSTRWDTLEASGGVATFNADRASTVMTTTGTIGSRVVRQTLEHGIYQPGKSFQWLGTCVFGAAVDGVRKRYGYFDDDNGVFLEQGVDGEFYWVVRSSVSGSPVDTRVASSAWNQLGLGELDPTRAWIVTIDFEWLGVGRVRCGFGLDGTINYRHMFEHANSVTGVYMTNPNLPVRGEIENVSGAGAASFEHICTTVLCESGIQDIGVLRSANRVFSLQTCVVSVFTPLISLRVADVGTQISPRSIGLYTSSQADFLWGLFVNPTIGGTDAASWSRPTGSHAEVDVSRDATNVVTGGVLVASGYTSSSNQSPSSIDLELGPFTLGTFIDGSSEELVLAVQPTGATEQFAASLNWIEFA